MKEIKKTINALTTSFILITIFMLICFVILFVSVEEIEAGYKKEVIVRDSIISEYAYRDSLILEHLKDCSFIDKNDIGVGHQGYLYSKYHYKNKIEE